MSYPMGVKSYLEWKSRFEQAGDDLLPTALTFLDEVLETQLDSTKIALRIAPFIERDVLENWDICLWRFYENSVNRQWGHLTALVDQLIRAEDAKIQDVLLLLIAEMIQLPVEYRKW